MAPKPASDWVGIGLRSPYHSAFADAGDAPKVDWLEVHAENYFDRGGPRYRALAAVAARYPIGVHGVALSLGSADGIDEEHLDRLYALVSDIGACQVSEHLAWSRPRTVLIRSAYPIYSIWAAHLDPAVADDLLAAVSTDGNPQDLLITKASSGEAVVTRLQPGETALVLGLLAGIPLGAVWHKALGADPQFDLAVTLQKLAAENTLAD